MPRGWMTKTGAVLSALSGAILGAVQVCPVAEWQPWMTFAATILGGLGVALIGQGIRRNLPTSK